MTITCAALMCHAPIVVPEIAGSRGFACVKTTDAMERVASAIVAHEPHVVVLISPHASRLRKAWGLVDDARIGGSFAPFGKPELEVSVPGARDAVKTLSEVAKARNLTTATTRGNDLDHGCTVPLAFLIKAGWQGATLVVGLPSDEQDDEEAFGRALAEAARLRTERWAVLASGDMSHRLERGAPAGFHPRAAEFDRSFVSHIRNGQFQLAVHPELALRELAAEDVVQSTRVAVAAADYNPRGLHVFSYEGPFGVGYLEAILHSDRARAAGQNDADPPVALVDLARIALRRAVANERTSLPALPPVWQAPRAVFVTLRGPEGELRGCIGRTEPALDSLAEEIVDCAVAAATRDPRVPPVSSDELDDLTIEVSLLDPAEHIDSVDDLDPMNYGVLVIQGGHRGVLLPEVEGVDTAEEQLQIAMRKGRINAQRPYHLARFRVHKVIGSAALKA
jgi:AmmeMemoRadiSam system protein A